MFSNYPSRDSEIYRKLLKDLNLEEIERRVGERKLGDFGDKVSGGERQRINIARVMCKNPSVLIFDEPTNGLDPDNVTLINNYIFNMKGVIRIVITHDWSQEYLSHFDDVITIGSKGMRT